MKKILTLIVTSILVLSLVAGCAPAKSAFPGTPDKGQVTINLGSEPPKLNSILTTDVVSFTVLRHVMEGLVVLDQNNQPQAGVAESWEVSKDGLTYTFKLRADAKWSDGKPVTAKDFEFAWKTALTASTAAEYSYFLFPIANAENFNAGKVAWDQVGVKVVDDTNLVVTLTTPVPYFLTQLAFGTFMPVREDAYGKDYATEATKMLYNGPYTITEWVHDDHIMLEKNPGYVGNSKPQIEKVKFLMIADSNTALNSFQSGELDMVGLRGEQVKTIKDAGGIISQYSDGSSWVVAFNHTNKMLANENLRKALTLSLDRQTFITNILKNNSKPAFGWTSPDISSNGKSFASLVGEAFKDNDVEGAKAALEAAKTELGVTEFKLSLITDDSDQARDNATYLQGCWKNIGVEVTISQMPFKERLARQTAKNYEISLYGWAPDYDDPMTFLDLWVTDGGNNIIGWSDAKYDEFINKAMAETDPKVREQLLVDAEKLLIQGYHVGPIYFRMRDYTVSGKVSGIVRNAFQDVNLMYAKVN